jgi:hypothetical protein
MSMATAPITPLHFMTSADVFAKYVMDTISSHLPDDTDYNIQDYFPGIITSIHDFFSMRWKEIHMDSYCDSTVEDTNEYVRRIVPELCTVSQTQKEGEEYIISEMTRCIQGCQNTQHPRWNMTFSSDAPPSVVQHNDELFFNHSRVGIVVSQKPKWRYVFFSYLSRQISVKIMYINVRWSYSQRTLTLQ